MRRQAWIQPFRFKPRLAHEGRRMGWEPPLPGPLLHKCVEEREKTGGFALREPAVGSNSVQIRLEKERMREETLLP
jgi:hypothetical protein